MNLAVSSSSLKGKFVIHVTYIFRNFPRKVDVDGLHGGGLQYLGVASRKVLRSFSDSVRENPTDRARNHHKVWVRNKKDSQCWVWI